MNGVILINKPLGKTSHDLVYEARRLTGVKKVGHTGTLDPMAEGVLPVCIGNATKAADALTASDKGYCAQLVLGMTTDTADAEGEILSECGVYCTREEIEKAVKSFEGEIEQIPPMYSAIKVNGKKLYELAREGKEIERKPRRITIQKIDILEIDEENNTVTIDVLCSKGTYIRTLCEDIGIKLGVGAYMNTLIRTKSGQFTIDQCKTVQELRQLKDEGKLLEVLIPTSELFLEFEKVTLNKKQAELVKNGVPIIYKGLIEGNSYRLFDKDEEFLSISEYIDGKLKLKKAFWN